MGLATPSFPYNIFSPPGGQPLVREPNKRWARGAKRPTLLALRVAKVVVETPTTRTFVLEGAGLAYRAGQHLTIVAEVEGRKLRRCYSFSSAPSISTPTLTPNSGHPSITASITVKRVEGGVLSNWLHDHVQVGDVLRSTPVSGRFVLEPSEGSARHLVMVAGGVGITPLISMAESVLRDEKHSRVTLLYGSRNQREIIFRERLSQLERRFPGRFDLRMAIDSEPADVDADADAEWTGMVGSIGADRVTQALRDNPDGSWFVCGPQPMMDAVLGTLEHEGVPSERIHSERFQYAETSTAAMPSAPATLVFATSAKTVTARVGATILDAADEAGIALPSSCRMGGCGACKVKVEGKVIAAQPNCLTDAEKAEGYALACCSWGDGRVVLRDF